jgi:hypothetical protein
MGEGVNRKQENEKISQLGRRRCCVTGCENAVPASGDLFCLPHWAKIPLPERREMIAARNAVNGRSRLVGLEALKARWAKAAQACRAAIETETGHE